jgi:hypothetical protein
VQALSKEAQAWPSVVLAGGLQVLLVEALMMLRCESCAFGYVIYSSTSAVEQKLHDVVNSLPLQ